MADRFPLIVDNSTQTIKELDSADNLNLTGNNAIFGDNDKAVFGTGSDLEIYHSGTNSFITEQGTGSLYISATNLNMRNTAATDTYLTAVENGAVNLYYDNSLKFATTSYGVSVSGSAVATTYIGSLSGAITLNFDNSQNFVITMTGNLTLSNPTTEKVGQSGFIVFIQDATGSRTVSLGTDYETAGGAGLTLSSTASATDVVPYIVAASGRILLGAPQLAFA